jgi:hypothetical protein
VAVIRALHYGLDNGWFDVNGNIDECIRVLEQAKKGTHDEPKQSA